MSEAPRSPALRISARSCLKLRVAGQGVGDEVRVVEDDGEQVVEVVGDSAGHLADRLEPPRPLELRVDAQAPELFDAAVGDVGRDGEARVDLARRGAKRRGPEPPDAFGSEVRLLVGARRTGEGRPVEGLEPHELGGRHQLGEVPPGGVRRVDAHLLRRRAGHEEDAQPAVEHGDRRARHVAEHVGEETLHLLVGAASGVEIALSGSLMASRVALVWPSLEHECSAWEHSVASPPRSGATSPPRATAIRRRAAWAAPRSSRPGRACRRCLAHRVAHALL